MGNGGNQYARKIRWRRSLRAGRDARINVGAKPEEIFLDVAKLRARWGALQIVPGIIVELSAENIFAITKFRRKRLLILRVETEVGFDHGDVSRKNLAGTDVVIFGARIIAQRVKAADPGGRVDSLDGLEKRGLAGFIGPDQNRFAIFDIKPAGIPNAPVFCDAHSF